MGTFQNICAGIRNRATQACDYTMKAAGSGFKSGGSEVAKLACDCLSTVGAATLLEAASGDERTLGFDVNVWESGSSVENLNGVIKVAAAAGCVFAAQVGRLLIRGEELKGLNRMSLNEATNQALTLVSDTMTGVAKTVAVTSLAKNAEFICSWTRGFFDTTFVQSSSDIMDGILPRVNESADMVLVPLQEAGVAALAGLGQNFVASSISKLTQSKVENLTEKDSLPSTGAENAKEEKKAVSKGEEKLESNPLAAEIKEEEGSDTEIESSDSEGSTASQQSDSQASQSGKEVVRRSPRHNSKK